MSATICVSGWPSMPAQTVTVNGARFTVAGSFTAAAAVVTKTMTWLAVVDRCRGCNTWLHTEQSQHRNFGPPYCLACATQVATRCRDTVGRLPIVGEEFYCGNPDGTSGCGRILPIAMAYQTDAKRWRCRPCRAKQWARANANRKERWGWRVRAR